MKILIVCLLIIGMPLKSLAEECNWSTGIEKLSDGRFAYSSSCHKLVGKTVADLKDREEQVAKLEKVIELKDLAINLHEKRADLWMNTSLKLEDRVNSIEAMRSTNQWLYFGLGVLGTSLAVWGAGQLARK